VPIKVAQGDLHKCIMWPNFFGKGRQEWENDVPPSSLLYPKGVQLC
jgi:hypothetical protein